MNDRRASYAINEAWDALYDTVPARWHVGRPSSRSAAASSPPVPGDTLRSLSAAGMRSQGSHGPRLDD
jgi:hypothetical protein